MKILVFLIFGVFLSAQDLISEIKDYVEARFKEYYAPFNIEIESLEIAPAMDMNLAKMQINSINFSDKDLKKDSGNFEVELFHNQKRQRVFFSFNINATIESLNASDNIKTGTILSDKNTNLSRVKLTRNMNLPSSKNVLNEYSAKSYIPRGSVIIDSKIAPKVVIKKGENIKVSYSRENIDIEFGAKALEDGAKGEIIRAQNIQSNKEINIEILDEKRAILR